MTLVKVVERMVTTRCQSERIRHWLVWIEDHCVDGEGQTNAVEAVVGVPLCDGGDGLLMKAFWGVGPEKAT